jgi:hypothetical protein
MNQKLNRIGEFHEEFEDWKTMNEDVRKMRAQILNLRCAAIACARAIRYFPPCGKPGADHLQCPEAGAALQDIYESMNHLMLSVRMVLTAVFHLDSAGWDLLWSIAEDAESLERDLAELGQSLYSDQDARIRIWSQIDDDTMLELGTSFSKEEWKVLTAKRAWQNGRRLSHVLDLLNYLDERIAEKFDLLDSILHSGLLGDCCLGRWAEKKKPASA